MNQARYNQRLSAIAKQGRTAHIDRAQRNRRANTVTEVRAWENAWNRGKVRWRDIPAHIRQQID